MRLKHLSILNYKNIAEAELDFSPGLNCIIGCNGEGKTTFARMLSGELEQSEGEIKIGANVSVGYYAQNQDDLMDG